VRWRRSGDVWHVTVTYGCSVSRTLIVLGDDMTDALVRATIETAGPPDVFGARTSTLLLGAVRLEIAPEPIGTLH
jgi:hypothetical protein